MHRADVPPTRAGLFEPNRDGAAVHRGDRVRIVLRSRARMYRREQRANPGAAFCFVGWDS
jgi:hypothetical protein